jgi:hypothetical protein
MRVVVLTSLASLTFGLAGCAENADAIAYLQKPRASVQLKKAAATLTHTSTTAWTLEKVGSVGVQSITWQATATQGATTEGLLIFNGIFRVENKGNAGATIGNIVVNLQTRDAANKWVTRSSVIADATQDDAATTAQVSPKGSSEQRSSFAENSASGSLVFTDATTNSAFALVPQVTIPPKTNQKLRFSASFDNNVLDIPVGTVVRAEIIVSFGNAKAGGNSTENVDINGNGIVDDDEQWVHSIAARIGAKVPAQAPSNTDVVLTDTVDDITTTGTVTFSNPMITINGLTALVTVNYNGGTEGGTITNCAHLTGGGQTAFVEDDQFPNVQPVDLTACSTLVIGPHACTPGTVGCGWKEGEVITYNQSDWGTPTTTAGIALSNHYNSVYASTFGIVEVGIPGDAGFSMQFSSADAVFAYQPSSGAPGALNADLVDPTSTASGVFGGEVLAARINIDFSDAGHTTGSSGLHFGDLTLCNTTNGPSGITVRAFLGILNTALGGGTTPYSIDDLNAIAQELNAAFNGGSPSAFAQAHVFNGPCPP